MKWKLITILTTAALSLSNSGWSASQETWLQENPTIWEENSYATKTSWEHTSKQALSSLHDIENLVIEYHAGGAVLKGYLLNPADMRRVILLSDSLDNVFNLCSYHPEALIAAASHIIDILGQNNINGLNLSPLGNALLLTGTPAEASDVSMVQRICKSLLIPLIDGTRSTVVDRRMVFFEVSFVEVNKDAFRELGIKWPSSTFLADPHGMRIGRLEPANALEVTIDHQVHKGNARIISKPRLVCASGQKASFQAGGEIPIPRSDPEGRISVSWKPYGIILEVQPSIDSENIIHVQIRSEVSMVDHANAIEGVPGILTRRVETYLSLENGQTIVLSGLVHIDDAENVYKIPLLGDIPIIGELFRSRSFQQRETELVVFLTPLPTMGNPLEGDDSRQTSTVGWSGAGPDPK